MRQERKPDDVLDFRVRWNSAKIAAIDTMTQHAIEFVKIMRC